MSQIQPFQSGEVWQKEAEENQYGEKKQKNTNTFPSKEIIELEKECGKTS